MQDARMHLITFSQLEELETTNPALVLRLYKLLTHVMARKEDSTIDQLSTLHNIMSSPAYSHNDAAAMSRSVMRKQS
jgi:uncharacterized protein YdiU (UPF0061 family)